MNVAVRKQALTVPLPAPRYWQSLRQQTRVTLGGAELSQRISPQRHPPVIVISSPANDGKAFDCRCYVEGCMTCKSTQAADDCLKGVSERPLCANKKPKSSVT